MNGAEALIQTAYACGIRVCFANPGTTELPLVIALDRVGGIKPVLCLFEGVCTGAADGYARIADRPAMTLLHLGPGFANGIANLHNAKRARSPVINVIGEHATWHQAADAPLASDIESLAKPVSAWIKRVSGADSVGTDFVQAVTAAGRTPGQIATLIVPADCLWAESQNAVSSAPPLSDIPIPKQDAIDKAAQALRHSEKSAILLGGLGLREQGLRAAGRLAGTFSATLICETFPARVERGPGLPSPIRLPYFPEPAIELLSTFQTVILAGARRPVAFFGYPGKPSYLIPPEVRVVELASPAENAAIALELLADATGASREYSTQRPSERPSLPSGPLDATTVGTTLAALAPDNVIVVDEAATSGLPFFASSASAFRHTYLALTGGAIGQGLPCATGAALASPERKVIAFQADGGALYTVQALWTQAREGLDVLTLICNNRSYRILQIELARAGIKEPGASAVGLTQLDNPPLDWVKLAQGMGVEAARVDSVEALAHELRRAFSVKGPYLIEMLMP